MNNICPVCLSNARIMQETYSTYNIDCPRCSNFNITKIACNEMYANPLDDDQIAKVSGWIRQNQGMTISSNKIEELKNIETPSVTEKANKLLLYLSKTYPTPGQAIPYEINKANPRKEHLSFLSITWSKNFDEFSYLFHDYLLQTKGYLMRNTENKFVISPDGWGYIDRIKEDNPAHTIGIEIEKNQKTIKEESKDVFLCHCSEDKKGYVEPLINQLSQESITYWYDKAEIKWGDSLLLKIHEGLKISKYVIVFLSKFFIKKGWAKHELENAMVKEIKKQKTVVLPLLIGNENEIEEILNEFEFIQTKKYLKFSDGTENIITELKNVLRET